MKKKLILVFSLIVILFLTGCSQKSQFSFYSGEKWKLSGKVDFDADVFQDLGSVIGSISGQTTGFEIPGSAFNPEIYLRPIMTSLVKQLRSQGIEMKWKYNRKLLTYNLSGKSYSALEQAGLITDLGDGTYRFEISRQDFVSPLGSGFDSMVEMFNDAYSDNVVEISVGKIYQSNADKIVGSKAIWYNPKSISITYKPGSGTGGILIILLILLAIALVVFLVMKLFRGQKKVTCYACGKRVNASYTECPKCGSYLDNSRE